MAIKLDISKYIKEDHMNSFGSPLQYWGECQVTGALYKKPYSMASIETNLRLINHFLKNLNPDLSNIKPAYIRTKIDTADMKSKSQIRLYAAVVSFVKSLMEGGAQC